MLEAGWVGDRERGLSGARIQKKLWEGPRPRGGSDLRSRALISPAFCSEDPDHWNLLGNTSGGKPLIVSTRITHPSVTLDTGDNGVERGGEGPGRGWWRQV